MGDAAYKKRKQEEWIAAGKCRRCGRTKAPAEKYCPRCITKHRARVESGAYKTHEQPRTDGNYVYCDWTL